jgi:type II secretory pathway pseudopilin PulG
MNRIDSAETILKETRKQYLEYGYDQKALETLTKLLHLYVKDTQKVTEVKHLIDEYETNYNLFDENHELPPSKRQFYYYKGKYFETNQRLDSAEYYYRKVFCPNMSFVSRNPMYEGLLSVYSKRHQADSIAKYAQLYFEVNDSSIAKKDQELTAKMSASYNYNRFQKLAQDNEKRANKNRMILIIIVGLVIIIALILWNLYQSDKRKKQRELEKLKSDYANATDEYNKNLHTLKLLEETRKSTISEMLKELTHTQDENISFRQQLEDQIAQYETTKEELENENESLKEKIAKLQKEEVISKYIDKSKRFKDTAIVDRFMLIAESPFMMPEDDEWEELVNTTSDYYPELIRDMNKLQVISIQEIRLCILVAMSIRESDVARMMGVSNQRITNIKSALNKKLFGDSSARSLYKNLSHRYDIFSQLAEA